MNKLILALALSAFALVPRASATMTGSLGFATPILTQASASPTGDINTSDVFTLEALVSTSNASGLFAGLPLQNFGTVTFDTLMSTSLHIFDTAFGSFTSQNITTISNTAGFLNLLVAGTWTPGTFNRHLTGGPFPANFRISFTQSPSSTGEISFSGTMGTLVPTPVPEPSTALLFMSGAVLVLAGSRLRKLLTSSSKGACEI